MPNKDGWTPIDFISDDLLKEMFVCLSKNSECPVFIHILLNLSHLSVRSQLCVGSNEFVVQNSSSFEFIVY